MMILTQNTRPVALCLFAFTLFAPFGCKSADSEGAGLSGAGISEPLTMLPEYQSRAPRKCAKVTKPPSAAQAAVLVQCTSEFLSPTGVGLVQDVKLEMGKSRPFVYQTDSGLTGIDLEAPVYPLRGSYTGYLCRLISNMAPAGQSCVKSVVPAASGWCWKTSFGDWKCTMNGLVPQMESGAAPTTF
jgi:hypothetical protein